jgi:serine/threonine-protein kinase
MHDTRGAARAVEQFAIVSETAWHKSDLTLGRGGVPLACAQLIEALPASMPEQATRLRGVGRRVLADLWRELDRCPPIGQASGEEDFSAAHGWSGLLYAALRWRDATGATLPRRLPRRLREVAAAAEALGRGVHWPQIAAGPAASIWATHQVAGWCNGPAGFVPLWTLADRHFPRSRYLALAEGAAVSTWEAPSLFFDLCCGLIGRAFALLNLYRYTGRAEWLDRAATLARRAARQFDRERHSLYLPLSLFKGEAGLAVLAAALLHPEASAFPLFEPEGFSGPASNG